MRRRVRNRWIACLLAPLVLLASVVPVGTVACQGATLAPTVAKKCCGCCQQRVEPVRACCQPKPACCAKSAAVAKPKCCCQKGTEAPATPATLPNDNENLVKQALVAGQDAAIRSTLPPVESLSPCIANAAADSGLPPVRVRFCTWQI
ncbi:MAG TPA: hypothetical protein VGG64_03800 [Pirellulales bacterium]